MLLHIIAAIVGALVILIILQDCFETIVLPRRVARKIRVSRLFLKNAWRLATWIARKIRSTGRRENFISSFGPVALLMLLVLWAAFLIVAFALLQWSVGSVLDAPEKIVTFATDLYMSGTTFFTLGLGDVTPRAGLARIFTVMEGGLGFGFLALVIGYLPVIYQAFSRREAEITLLDARAGSPPSASEFLRRHIQHQRTEELQQFLRDWERWCSELMESHLSYPVLMYYRSQHDRQSWLAALTIVLDVSALVMLGLDNIPEQVGQFTFAIARHAAVDLSQSTGVAPATHMPERLSSANFARLQELLTSLGIAIRDEESAEMRLATLRSMYEPYVYALSQRLMLELPEWVATEETIDDWQSSVWDHFALTSQRPMKKAG
ncbi:MAG TPA: potassium channel family protein [Ktedonosporobacter sp.]|nr:potassium channel family protein [Ktedonosporobacter sp.]